MIIEGITTDTSSFSEPTMNLRYKKIEIDLRNGTAKTEYRLQQMFKNPLDGSTTWEWIEQID